MAIGLGVLCLGEYTPSCVDSRTCVPRNLLYRPLLYGQVYMDNEKMSVDKEGKIVKGQDDEEL